MKKASINFSPFPNYIPFSEECKLYKYTVFLYTEFKILYERGLQNEK